MRKREGRGRERDERGLHPWDFTDEARREREREQQPLLAMLAHSGEDTGDWVHQEQLKIILSLTSYHLSVSC